MFYNTAVRIVSQRKRYDNLAVVYHLINRGNLGFGKIAKEVHNRSVQTLWNINRPYAV